MTGAKAGFLLGAAVLATGSVWVVGGSGERLSFVPPARAQVDIPAGAQAQSPGDAKCAGLAQVALADTKIVSAALQPAKLPVPGAITQPIGGLGAPTTISGLPAFCRVIGRIHPEPGSEIRFEVWLPAEGWNGRYTGVGNGGFAGSINYLEMGPVISAGQATSSTDTGHEGGVTDADWARGSPGKLRDYGWRAVHLTATNAKRLVAAFYGRPAEKSYFQSCSNGGRQALMEASRFPEDYDGIMAGAPAAQFTKVAMAMIWTQQAQTPVGAAIRPEQIKLLNNEVLRQCDGLDGQQDGLIDDPRMCQPDLAKLACGNSASPQCFAPAQMDALRKIYDGPPSVRGQRVAFPYPPSGAEVGRPVPFLGWEGFIARGGKEPPQNALFPRGLLQDMPSAPIATVERFNWKVDPARLTAALGGVLDAQPDMTRYFARGGKLIIYHGWADAAIPPAQTIDFYQSILRRSGPRADKSVKLFMIPGMQHCFGGTGAGMFGQLTPAQQNSQAEDNLSMALQRWVEGGQVPTRVIGTKGFAPKAAGSPDAQQRLHCAYPDRAVLTPGANPDRAASYTCRPAPNS